MNYSELLDTLIANAGTGVKVTLSNFNSAQASVRRALKKYNNTVKALEVGVPYSLVCLKCADVNNTWEFKLIPLDDTAKITGVNAKFIIIDEAQKLGAEVSDDEFDWSVS